MQIRRTLLRIMLWSLALAAVTGALSVLVSAHETAWRVVGTMVVTAVAAGLLMWTSALSERERTREAGLLGMGAVIAEWVLAELLIWDVRGWFGWGWRVEERIALTMFFGAATTIWTMLALSFRRRSEFTIAAITGLGLAAIVAALWLVGTWWPADTAYSSHTDPAEKLLRSSGAVAMMGILASLLLIGFGTRRWWFWPALLCNAVALSMWLTGIALDIRHSNGTTECLVIVAVVGVGWNLLRHARLRDGQLWLIWGTMAAVAVTGLLVGSAIVLDKQHADVDLMGRLASATGILSGCGFLAIVVLSRLNRQDVRPTEMPAVESITVICPICQKKQAMKLGESRCSGCGLVFEIKVKEPRCPQCNYLLFMLKADRCPECGTAIG